MTHTSLRIDTGTRDRLKEIGKKNESYDTLINRLLDHYHNFTIIKPKGIKKK